MEPSDKVQSKEESGAEAVSPAVAADAGPGSVKAEKSSGFCYPECQKGGFHVGESLNLVCLQPKCIDKSVICCLCYDEEHKGHKIKPLKLVIERSKKYLTSMTPLALDSGKIKESITTSEAELLKRYSEFEKKVLESLASIKDSIRAAHVKMVQQVDLKTGSNKEMIATLDSLSNTTVENDVFVKSMQKLMAGVPLENEGEEEQANVSEGEVQQAITSLKSKLESEFEKKTDAIITDLKKYLELLQKTSENPHLFGGKIEFKFSPELHHAGVSVVSDTIIKSTEGFNYHFALMQPSLQSKGNKPQTVSFKIKENSTNWLAVGICQKNVVVGNGFNFSYSTLGHGAFMISSNGGSWSSISNAHNNVVTSFTFSKGDVINVNYDPQTMKVTFTRKDSEDKHVIDFECPADEQLCLCGLFYYSNDEIEYLGPTELVI